MTSLTEMESVKIKVENAMNEASLEDIKMVTPDIIKKAGHIT